MTATLIAMTTQSTSDVLPQGTRIGRTALRVNDLDAVTRFYRDVVGLHLLRQSGRRSIVGDGDTPLVVLEEDEDATERPASSAGLFHTAFRVPSRAALGDALTRVRTQWQLGGASDHWVSEALYTRDPEGNGVEIYRDLPREEWPMSDDGRVRIGTEPLDIDSIEALGAGDTRVPAGTDIGHVHLEVSSLDAFENFYIEALGFEMQTALANAYFVSAGGYHHHLGANTWNNRTEPITGRGLSWIEVVLPETQALDALKKRLAISQYSVTETGDGIAVTDPDEIEVRVRVREKPSTPR